MAAPTTLGIDAGAVKQQVSNSASSGTSTFDSILATTQYSTAVFAPTMMASAESMGASTDAQTILSAALNATNEASMSTTALGYTTGGTTNAYSATGATNYITGGTTSGYSYTDTSSTGVDLEAMQYGQIQLIAMQSAIQNITLQTNMTSTALKDKHDAEMAVINKWG